MFGLFSSGGRHLKIVARDDYGFSKATLSTKWISEGRERAIREFEIPGSRTRAERLELGYFWDLAGCLKGRSSPSSTLSTLWRNHEDLGGR